MRLSADLVRFLRARIEVLTYAGRAGLHRLQEAYEFAIAEAVTSM
jgi:hypothetical protein